MKKCPNCQYNNTDDMSFCIKCGSPLATMNSSQPMFQPTQPSQMPQSPSPQSNQPQMYQQSMQQAPQPPDPFSNTTPVALSPAEQALNYSESISNKKKTPTWVIISIVAACVIICVLAIVLIIVLSNSNNAAKNENEAQNTSKSESVERTVVLGKYIFTIPDGYQYKMSVNQGSQTIILTDESNDWLGYIHHADDMAFAQIENNIDSQISYYTGQGLTVLGSNSLEINHRKFYYADFKQFENNCTVSYTSAGTSTFQILTGYNDGTLDTDHALISKIEPIIASAKDSTRSDTIVEENSLLKMINGLNYGI